MDHEDDASRELIKCVVVGDTGVGKTRLICAKACGQKSTLEQLINVHVPTVWAIDQYRICREVLERSFEVVDGIRVAIRIWDTIGDHHYDRCFAYGRSDVILLCYSVANIRSLENAMAVWYPEIRRQRPNVPLLLVGCKNDLRYLCLQPEFHRLLAQRRPSPLKPIHDEDIVTPEQGRSAAKEIGAFYYETSVLTRFGVEETFHNAVRAALCRRRQGRLWSGHFHCVKLPQVQAPFLPPKPASPRVNPLPSCYLEQMAGLVAARSTATADQGANGDHDYTDTYYDCLLKVADQMFMVHKLLLASSSRIFYRLFVCTNTNCERCCVNDDDDSEESDEPLANQDFMLFEKTDKDFLLNVDDDDNDDGDEDGDVFCLSMLHRTNGGGGGNAGSSSSTCGKDGATKQHQQRRHKRGKSADLANSRCTAAGNNSSLQKNRHATIGGGAGITASNSRPIHAKSTSTAISEGLPTWIGSLKEDFRRRTSFVIIPLTTVQLTIDLSPAAVKAVLQFMYCGQLQIQTSASSGSRDHQQQEYSCSGRISSTSSSCNYSLDDLLKVAEAFEIDSLRQTLSEQIVGGTGILLADARFLSERRANLVDLGLGVGLFSDVKFIVEDGVVRAQKFLLCGRCDVMRAMFSNAFRESCLSQVALPGVGVNALRLFLSYLCVDSICYDIDRPCHLTDFLEALELANRMCLPRLIAEIEAAMVREMERSETMQDLNMEEVLLLLEPAQMCNATQLVAWCFHYLCCNYSRLCDQCGKLMKTLLPSNQDYIAKHRWPPLWYLKEFDWHDRMIREGQRATEVAANKLLKRARTSGCLCFASRTSARLQHNSI